MLLARLCNSRAPELGNDVGHVQWCEIEPNVPRAVEGACALRPLRSLFTTEARQACRESTAKGGVRNPTPAAVIWVGGGQSGAHARLLVGATNRKRPDVCGGKLPESESSLNPRRSQVDA
jgi:hypothetical protein